MLCITLEFPLGVYYARSAQSNDEPEWPPSPVRLVGALLAAAHSGQGQDLAADLALVQRLCEADPPRIVAPRSTPVGEAEEGEAAILRGPSRWAPRNYFGPKGRQQAAVEKVGVAIGDRPLRFVWPEVTLDAAELDRLTALASELTFLGTTRSPVIALVSADAPTEGERAWVPLEPHIPPAESIGVRVPDPATISSFDTRHQLFRSTKSGVQRFALVPSPPIGYLASYAFSEDLDAAREVFDPRRWGEMIVLSIDRDAGEIVPMSAGSYLLARAMRVALLGAYANAGEPGEAPPILRDRGTDPHCAIVPLPDVWHEHSDGHIVGIALLLPSEEQVPGLAAQRSRVEDGLAQLVRDTPEGPRRYIQIPGAGKVWLKQPSAQQVKGRALGPHTYRGPARSWVTIAPVVHSRWQKRNDGGLLAQVARDCAHVGLPRPDRVEALRGSGCRAGAARPVPPKRVPAPWRDLLTGPINHLRITFPIPVMGPIVLGKARHFGLGLCVPDERPTKQSDVQEEGS